MMSSGPSGPSNCNRSVTKNLQNSNKLGKNTCILPSQVETLRTNTNYEYSRAKTPQLEDVARFESNLMAQLISAEHNIG
eukprot:6462051-Amphidinium_carterae.1